MAVVLRDANSAKDSVMSLHRKFVYEAARVRRRFARRRSWKRLGWAQFDTNVKPRNTGVIGFVIGIVTLTIAAREEEMTERSSQVRLLLHPGISS